jgi:ketosteroid isomerase-like protein
MDRRKLLATACSSVPFYLATRTIAQLKPAAEPSTGSSEDRESLKQTGDRIRAAFARGDLAEILAFHHPDVIKALAYNRYLVGIDALRQDLHETLQAFTLEFTENTVESTLFHTGTAVETSLFAIQGTPKTPGAPFQFKGRSMVVYVRYSPSPTGWASIREIVQPVA